MKAWSARSRKDKAARIALSLAILGFVPYGAVKAGFEVYDYYTADACKAAIREANEAGLMDGQAAAAGAETQQQASAGFAIAARKWAAALDGITCPTSIAGAQDEFVAALYAYADVQQRVGDGESVTYDERAAATDKAGAALRKLAGLVGE
jgi:hypothetical protein